MKVETIIEHWISMLAQYRYETGDFSARLHTLTDAELLAIKPVTLPFLDLAPRMAQTAKPKYLPELRRAIAYLADLYERQSAAMERECERFERQAKEQARILKILQNAPITNTERINLVKQHYGWV